MVAVSVIKGIQRGTITSLASTTATATITAVNTAKSVLIHMGNHGTASTPEHSLFSLALTNSTTVTATKGATGVTATVGFEVVEYY